MALSKVSTSQTQLKSNTINQIPIIKSVPSPPVVATKIGSLGSISPNITIINSVIKNEFYASKLINYVEPVDILGEVKTVFYSELATNFKIGDRVFILNGVYDSADFIEKDKYTQFADGYRVLGVDGCRIILDIEYTGKLPYIDFNIEDLLFVHNISTQEQFDLINSTKIGLLQTELSGAVSSFEYVSSFGRGSSRLFGRNIAFLNQQFLDSTDELNFSLPIQDFSVGFYCKFGNEWVNVTEKWNDGSFIDGNIATNPNRSFRADRVLILGEDFTFNGKTYRERQVYKFDPTKAIPNVRSGDWVFDKQYKQPIISKLNFRYGKFSGVHNDGVFGSYDKVAKWDNSVWNSGVLVNGNWISGNMNTKSKTEKSFSAKLTFVKRSNRIQPVQNIDLTNNRGFGYNYIIDSTILKSDIKLGNFENSNLGLNVQKNVIEARYNKTDVYSVKINSAYLSFCNIYNSLISDSSLSENIVENTNIINGKLLNNQILDSVVSQSQYSSNGGIQIIGADLWSYLYGDAEEGFLDPVDFTKIVGTLKLYISDKDFLKLEKGDSFFIEKINKELFLTNLTNDEKIHLPIENRFLIDFYEEYEIFETPGTRVRMSVSIKPKTNNYTKYYVSGITDSIDVIYYEPNTDSDFWIKIDNYFGDWSLDDREYAINDFVKWKGNDTEEKFYFWTGNTDVNSEPVDPPVGDVYPWEPAEPPSSKVVKFWATEGIYFGQDLVLAYTVNTGTYSLFLCIADNFGSGGIVFDESIKTINKKTTGYKRNQITEDNPSRFCSIDIETEAFGWFFNPKTGLKQYTEFASSNNSGLSKFPIDSISSIYSNNYIKLSDFRSGLISNSTWQSGSNIGYYGNIISKNLEELSISSFETDLSISVNNNPFRKGSIIKGFDIKEGDTVWLSGISQLGSGIGEKVDGRYIVISAPDRSDLSASTLNFILKPTFRTTPFTTDNFAVIGAEGNTYVSISKFLIEDSVVNYGLFKRTSLNNVLITNDKFDNRDTTFNPSNTSLLRMINILFRNNNLTVNDGIMYRSHFVDGEFNLGIVHNSVWNGNTFSNGIFSAGAWVSGRFLSGKFLDSNQTQRGRDYHNDSLFYKNWQNGTFVTGEFVNSVWLNGTFDNGRFYGSHFYGGVWNNGILGSKNLRMVDTSFGYYKKLDDIGITVSTWNYGVVENAILGGYGVVYWYDGKCNAGEFTSFGTTSENESIWYNGEFNGSKFTHLARWKNGIFNSGKFWSYYGWENVGPTIYSDRAEDYSWETGRFVSGEFGYRGLTSNSTWYSGQFLGGQFLARFWRGGNFISGNFYGSGSTQSIDSSESSVDEFNFADSFTSSFYGMWADGIVTNNTKNLESSVTIDCQNNRVRAKNSTSIRDVKTSFNNMLWLGGTFSHDNAVLNDSLWLSGNFVRGEFNGGVFNPYIDRDFTGSFSNSRFGQEAVWTNGTFVTGSMYNCEWFNGVFKNGYISGVVWGNGTFEYGSADNIYWLDGTWKNGNWNGSPFKYDLVTATALTDFEGNIVEVNLLNNGREKDIMLNIANYISPNQETSQLHLMNIFSASATTRVLELSNDSIRFLHPTISSTSSWTYSTEYYVGLAFDDEGNLYDENLTKSEWQWSRNFKIVTSTEPASVAVPVVPQFSSTIGSGRGGSGTDTDTINISSLFGTSNRAANTEISVGDTSEITPTFGEGNKPGGGVSIIEPVKENYVVQPSVKPKTISTSSDGNIVTVGGTNSYVDVEIWQGYNYFTQTDVPPSSKLFAKFSGTQNNNIFTVYPSTYTVEFIVAVELVPTVQVEVFVGGLSSSIFDLETDSYRYTEFEGNNRTEYYDYYARVYRINLSYNTSAELITSPDGQKLAIRKNSNGIFRILSARVSKRDIQYHPTLNNSLYRAIDLTTNTITFPATSSISLTTVSSNGYEIGMNFGNGVFRSGIWENGVWNNGYRSSDWFGRSDVVRALDIVKSKTYKGEGYNTWRITVNCIDQLVDGTGRSLLNPNKRVSVGNLVNVNINGKRTYLREPLRIVGIDILLKEVTFEFTSNFEVRDIQKDSSGHLIYLTQNIWQNGVFLNGYFKGIWSNGVFKGYPRTTEMVDSHWVTGYFEGGHFKSTKRLSNQNQRLPEYNTGLIQNITFKDRNVARSPSSAYESWMDLTWNTQSYVNLNIYSRLVGVSLKNISRIIESFSPNKSGSPTFDVLSSDSFFRNSKNPSIRRYSLGSKYNISKNLVPNNGKFLRPFLDSYGYNLTGNFQKFYEKVGGITNFIEDGWTFSYLAENDHQLRITSNISLKTEQNFEIFVKQQSDSSSFPALFINNNKILTRPDRYYISEVKVTTTASSPDFNLVMSDTSLGTINDIKAYTFLNSKVATEYYFNKRGLDLTLELPNTDGASMSVENISFYEVDSIPFFKYYQNDSQIDFSIKNPYSGVAPVIDYTNKNFDFIGNVELGIDYRVIVKQNASTTRVGYANTIRNYIPVVSGSSGFA